MNYTDLVFWSLINKHFDILGTPNFTLITL